jgi:site-specific recombinase XerD
MARQKKRPALTHCKVTQTANERAPWRVWFTTEDNGKPRRVFKSYASEEEAWTFATDRENEIANHGVRYGDIPPEVRRAFDFYRDERASLEAEGATVPRFEDLVSDALAEIRRAHVALGKNSLPVAEAVAIFTDYKKTRVGNRQLADLKDRLKRFAQDFGTRPMPSITTAEIETWLSSLRSRRNPKKLAEPPLLAPLSRNHYRATLHAFFSFATAAARSWCAHNPVADLEPERFETEEPEAYSPEDVGKIMQTALNQKPELVPILALGMFAGLRVSEAAEIDLGKLPKDGDEFKAGAGRKTSARMAPLTAACKAWLAACSRQRGKAWQTSPRSMVDEMQELFTLAKVEQIFNGARHSFISYRTAETRDVARVADECGNSVSTIKNHYRQLVTAEAAKRFFAIRPEKKGAGKSKVVNIEAGRVSA